MPCLNLLPLSEAAAWLSAPKCVKSMQLVMRCCCAIEGCSSQAGARSISLSHQSANASASNVAVTRPCSTP